VNSRHHQAAKSLGPEWRATAHAPDGVVEALELPGHPFALGVQWHPEDMQHHEPQRRLLAGFVAAANAYAART
jgi:gamma-glutamyl-gamma-aminobutyrate hydrolase PuuD